MTPELSLTTLFIAQRGMGKTILAKSVTASTSRLIVIDTFCEHTRGIVFYRIRDALRHMNNRAFRIIYRPMTSTDRDIRYLFYGALAAGDVTILVEEISQYCTAFKMTPGLEESIRMGRHRRCRVAATTQRPADVHKLVLSQADLYLGRMFETNDIRYLSAFYENADKLKDLPEPKKSGGKIHVAFVRPLIDNTVRVMAVDLTDLS